MSTHFSSTALSSPALSSTADAETAALVATSGSPPDAAVLPPSVAERAGEAAAVEPSTRTRASGSRRRSRIYTALSWLSPLIVLGVWQGAVTIGNVSPQVLPSPGSVFSAGRTLWDEGQLQSAILVSLRRVGIGYAIGATLGLVVGIVVGFSPFAKALVDRPVQMFRAIPFFAITPLVIVWFGIGEQAAVFLVALAVFFGIYINTTLGIRQVDPKLVEMGRAAGLSPLRVIGHVILPAAVPSILTGVRVSLTTAWLALVVAETLGSSSGIGFLAENAREFLQTNIIVLVIVIYAVIGVLSDQLARLLERRLLAWHPNFAKARS
jgi:sulfonate transport system permease protein